MLSNPTSMDLKFPKNIHPQLGYYVYLYRDPFTDEIFYVGKGNGNRAFAHLDEVSESDKIQRINKIRNRGAEPLIEILVHGLEDELTAMKIEASVIDLFGLDKLTNQKRGYESREFGRMTVQQIIATYQLEPVTITEPSLLINLTRTFRYGMSRIELYEVTRAAWRLGPNRQKAMYAMAVYSGIVQEVYRIGGWFPFHSTLSERHDETFQQVTDERWEFVGNIAEDAVREKYLYKEVSEWMAPQYPVSYIRCD